MSRSENYVFGHPIYCESESRQNEDGSITCHTTGWRFADNDEPVDHENVQRRCPTCKLTRTVDGHDPCIANLPGVKFACCGHGVHDGAIHFEDGTIIRGRFTHIQRNRTFSTRGQESPED